MNKFSKAINVDVVALGALADVLATVDDSKIKKAVKKPYSIWVSKMPVGSFVVNKLENVEAWDELKTFFGRGDVFTPEFCKRNDEVVPRLERLAKEGKAYVVGEDDLCLCGTVGECWLIKPEKLRQRYRWENGKPIEKLPINAKLGGFDWKKVRTVSDGAALNYAVCIPKDVCGFIKGCYGGYATLGYNLKGVSHGKGDFFFCGIGADGNPDLSDYYVVNGLVFRETYDNSGFEESISYEEQLDESLLPKIYFKEAATTTNLEAF